jgi:hypothetical protein
MTSLAQGEGMLIETAFYTDAQKGLPWAELFKSRGKYVFHYTKLDTALRHILSAGQLRLGPYAKTNDPRESKDWEFNWITDIPSRVPDSVRSDLSDRANAMGKRVCRVLCTTQDAAEPHDAGPHFGRGYCHPRMWEQYAGGHSGVCLVFDKSLLNAAVGKSLGHLGQLFSGKVLYADRTKDDLHAFRLDYLTIQEDGLEIVMQRKLKQFHQTYFFQKALDWQQEEEYRWVLVGNMNTPECCYIDVLSSLKYIILGADCAEVYWPSLAFICEERAIPIGRLVWRSGQPFFTGSVTSAGLRAVSPTR